MPTARSDFCRGSAPRRPERACTASSPLYPTRRVRATVRALPVGHAITAPVRSYEEHVGRALLAEGFRESATSMLFVKELALKIEEPAFAPAVVR